MATLVGSNYSIKGKLNRTDLIPLISGVRRTEEAFKLVHIIGKLFPDLPRVASAQLSRLGLGSSDLRGQVSRSGAGTDTPLRVEQKRTSFGTLA